jgi:hypothetical protein
VPRRPHAPASLGGDDARGLEALAPARHLDGHDARIGRLEPEPGAEAVGQGDIVLVDGLDADAVDELDGRLRAHHENQAGDVSRRRALRARRSGGPNELAC